MGSCYFIVVLKYKSNIKKTGDRNKTDTLPAGRRGGLARCFAPTRHLESGDGPGSVG